MTSYQPPTNGWRTFVIVWLTQSVSVFGSALTFFAITIWLTQTLYPNPEQKPELALALSAIAIAHAIPIVFGAPIAGAWADRHDRKRTMMAMDFLSGGLSLIIAATMLTQTLNIWLLIGFGVVASIVSAFHNSAFDTSYAMLVSEKQLPRANGMMQTIWSLSGILSPAIAASIISLPVLARQGVIGGGIGEMLATWQDGAALAITIDAITFFFAAAALTFLFIPSPQRADLTQNDGTRKSIWADVKEGALFIWHRRPMLWLLGTFTVANFVGSPMGVLQPLIVKFNLAADWSARGFTFETALALLATLGSLGGVAGGVFISAWGGLKKRRVYGVVVSMMLSGIAILFFGISSFIFLSAAMAFVTAVMIPIMNAHSQTIWQSQTPRELQGRVFAVRRLIAQFSSPLSIAIAGIVGGVFNPGTVVAVLGGILVLFCIAQMFNPYLLRVEDKEYLDQLAASASSK